MTAPALVRVAYVSIFGELSPENPEIHIRIMDIDPSIDVPRFLDLVLAAEWERPHNVRVREPVLWVPDSVSSLSLTIFKRMLGQAALDTWATEASVYSTMADILQIQDGSTMMDRKTYIVTFMHIPHPPPPLLHSDDNFTVDSVSELAIKKLNRHVSASKARKTPSEAAKSTNYKVIQGSENPILDGRFNASSTAPGTAAPPVELYHKVFSEFIANADDVHLNVPEQVVRDTAELMRGLSAIFSLEITRDRDSRRLLAAILGTPLITLSSDRTSSDYMVSQKIPLPINDIAAPGIVEVKAEMGSGGSDPSVQVSFSFDRYHCLDEHTQVREACCCPAFLISLAGPWIVIMGAVLTTQTIVQRLSAYEWLGCSRILDDAQVIESSRRFYALRLALRELEDYYLQLLPPIVPDGGIHPRFCPSITSFVDSTTGHSVDFDYVRPLEEEPTCVTFLSRRRDTQEEVVVKFVRRYGKEAHEWMAERTWAPRLLHHGILGAGYGDLALVVMEYVKGRTLEERYPTGITTHVRDSVARCLKAFNEAGFLFADLRRPNIMRVDDTEESAEGSIRFIDFDWACKEGDGARYPVHLSSFVKDVSGARDYDIITKEHQDEMFNAL